MFCQVPCKPHVLCWYKIGMENEPSVLQVKEKENSASAFLCRYK